jgi:PAS domain S-box-containing protein
MNVLQTVLQRKGNSLTDFLSEISSTKIISFDYESLKLYLKNILKDEDVVYAMFQIDHDNTYIARHIPLHNTPWENRKTKNEDILAIAHDMKKQGYVLEYSRDITYNDVKVGAIIIGISRENLISMHKQAVQNMVNVESSLYGLLQNYFVKFGFFIVAVYGSAFLLISVLIYFIVRTFILKKLQIMAKGFSRVAKGDLDRKITIDSSDEIGDLCSAFNDMTTALQQEMEHRKQTEKELRESEERYRDLMENSNDFIMSVSPNAELLYANRAWRDTIGYSKEELAGRSMMEIIRPDKHDSCKEKLGKLLCGHETSTLDTVFVTKDGKEIDVEGNCNCKFIEGEPAYIRSIFRDVTERKQMEAQLQKSQKLESIGLIAGGIAHDFNNLLGGLHGLISVVKSSLTNHERQVEMLTEAQNSCMKGKELTSKFITFAEGGAPYKRKIHINSLVQEAVEVATSSFEIECSFHLDENLLLAEVDESQLRQAINNIVVNGCESMNPGGTLTVRTENYTVRENDGIPLKPGKYVCIDIQDQGKGIPQEYLPKIFDPYFTTKKMTAEKGTGFGLSICHSIIKKHQGEITVESKEWVGTSFHIYLPAFSK